MSSKVIIFDFDGTIADSRMTLIRIANDLAEEFGYHPVTEDDIIRLSNLSSQEVLKQSPIPPYKLPFLLRKVKKELNKHIINLTPFEGMREALESLKSQKFNLGIVTSNLRKNVISFLAKNNLMEYFDFVYSDNTLFGKHKIINKVIKKHNLLVENIIYVGDETRDIEAARKSKVKVIAVTWGFNSKEVLQNHHPDFMIYNPSDLPIILEKTI